MEHSYLELRAKTAKKDKGLKEKVMSLTEAVTLIPDNVHVAIGGCHYSRTPIALIWEIIRQKKSGLVFSKSITATEGDLLLVAGTTRHIITSWFSPGVTWEFPGSEALRAVRRSDLRRVEPHESG
jgi:glutaconate CoA-transferase subunit A